MILIEILSIIGIVMIVFALGRAARACARLSKTFRAVHMQSCTYHILPDDALGTLRLDFRQNWPCPVS